MTSTRERTTTTSCTGEEDDGPSSPFTPPPQAASRNNPSVQHALKNKNNKDSSSSDGMVTSCLLNPNIIKNIADHFSIDIAHELENYREELDQLTITFNHLNSRNVDSDEYEDGDEHDGMKNRSAATATAVGHGGFGINFAQAALMIQNSTCVYSKKVELLYHLVYDVLNHLKSNKSSVTTDASSTTTKRRGKDTGENEILDNGLKPLDQWIREQAANDHLITFHDDYASISRGEDDAETEIDLRMRRKRQQLKQRQQNSLINTNVNLFLHYNIPMNIAYEDVTAMKSSLEDNKTKPKRDKEDNNDDGDDHKKSKKLLLSQKQNGETNFKLSSCIVHDSSGSLLLQREDEMLMMNKQLQQVNQMKRVSFGPQVLQFDEEMNGVDSDDDVDDMVDDQGVNDQNDAETGFGGDERMFNGDDGEVGGSIYGDQQGSGVEDMMLSEKQVYRELARHSSTNNNTNGEEASEEPNESGNVVNMTRFASFLQVIHSAVENNNDYSCIDSEEVNVWEPLDPHEENHSKKPFKLKRDFKPPSVPKSDKFDTFKNKTKKLDVSSILSTRDLQRHLFKQQRHTHLFPPFTYELTQYSKLNFNHTYHPELNFVLPFELSRKKRSKVNIDQGGADLLVGKETIGASPQRTEEEEVESTYDEPQSGYVIQEDEIDMIDDEDQNEMVDQIDPDSNSNSDEKRNSDNTSTTSDDEQNFGGDIGFTDFDDIDHKNQQTTIELRDYSANRKRSDRKSVNFLEESGTDILLQDGFLSNAVHSYEELCKKHLERYMRSTDRHALDSRRIQRVNDWQSKINPVLNLQSKRSKYDIYAYGEALINQLSNTEHKSTTETKTPVNFARIAEKKPTHEVCRLFLATLQLANMGNIEIQGGSTLEQCDSFGIKLLSDEIEYTNFEGLTNQQQMED